MICTLLVAVVMGTSESFLWKDFFLCSVYVTLFVKFSRVLWRYLVSSTVSFTVKFYGTMSDFQQGDAWFESRMRSAVTLTCSFSSVSWSKFWEITVRWNLLLRCSLHCLLGIEVSNNEIPHSHPKGDKNIAILFVDTELYPEYDKV
jgi:hypothetical protein